MATLQELKKKLRGIQSTVKLTKAMKTVSAAKYSKLNRTFGEYSSYADACFSLYKNYESEINALFPKADKNAPAALFVMSGNKGMCGGFNTEILTFALNQIKNFSEDTLIFPCGKKAISFFNEKNIPYKNSYIFSDTPDSYEVQSFLSDILSMREKGIISSVYVVYPKYKNVMNQIPVITELFKKEETFSEENSEDLLFIPDKKTVLESIAQKVIFTAVFGFILETALGAQAATLTTMRSAYDTAVSYSMILETQINRKRQSEVTADVLETSQG